MRRRRYASCCPGRRFARRGFLTEFRPSPPDSIDQTRTNRAVDERSLIIPCLPLPNRQKETLMKPKQECHGARRRLHSRALLGSLVLASASLSACGDDHGEDSADLQAILHDGDLTEIMRSMLMDAAHRRWRGTSGGTTGAAGSGARARAPGARPARPGAGIPGTGIAGSIGSAGTGVRCTGIAGSFGAAGTAAWAARARPAASLGRPRASGASTTATWTAPSSSTAASSATTRRSAR